MQKRLENERNKIPAQNRDHVIISTHCSERNRKDFGALGFKLYYTQQARGRDKHELLAYILTCEYKPATHKTNT